MTTEIERLIADASKSPALRQEIVATNDVGALAALLGARGYAISRAEIEAQIAARRAELTDQELYDIAGGGQFTINITNNSPDQSPGGILIFQKDPNVGGPAY